MRNERRKKTLAAGIFSCNLRGVSSDSAPYQPFVLNRDPARFVFIYGDTADKVYGKLVWSYLSELGLKVINTNEIQDVIGSASDCILAFIVLGPNGEGVEAGEALGRLPNLVGEVLGLGRDIATERRLELMARGFDGIFNHEIVTGDSFQSILFRKIEKAKLRQTHLIMQQEYRRFRAALSASPDAFIVLDERHNIFFVSEHYRRTYPGLSQYLIRGQPIAAVFEIARRAQGMKDDNPQYPVMQKFWTDLQGKVEFRMPDGRTWRVKASPLAEGQGSIITTTDISDLIRQRKVIEEKSRQLADALQKEQEASALQKQFIGMVSHEFRTPLAIIDGHAQMLTRPGREPDPEQVQARCKTIRSAVSRLVHMMESVLSSNMLKTGRLDPEITAFSLGVLIQELCEEQQELSKPDTISWDVDGLADPVRLDKKMMTLILSNLLSNAVKFSAEKPKISVTATSRGGQTEITVSDNGIGIPENELERIFDRYYRATTSSGIPGTGIGLNLVQSLLGLMQGSIRVASKVGKGTRFTISLPDFK